MANIDDHIHMSKYPIKEGLLNNDFWNHFDFRLVSYVKSPIQLHCISSKTSIIARALRHAIIDLLEHICTTSNGYIENETTVLGTEHRLYHSRRYSLPSNENTYQYTELNNRLELEISSLAPTVFSQLRDDIRISNRDFCQSFARHHLKDFTNPGKSGSLMYKTSDDLFLLKTLREYEARLLLQILSGYHLQLTQRSTLFNRYVGLYCIRFPAMFGSIEIYIVVMVNAFTPSMKINEIFDLKGSSIKRRSQGNLSKDKLHQMKDLDFLHLYPHGIRVPSNIYHRLRTVISNDAKVLKKLCITDYSLVLGIRHVDVTEDDLMQRRPSAGVSALFHMSHRLAMIHMDKSNLPLSSSTPDIPISFLKPLEILEETFNQELFYRNDRIAAMTFPIPGLINPSNQRVYIYLAIVDMLQTYDNFKHLEQTLKKITDYSRHLQYSVIEPEEYEKRFVRFLFEEVFHDAGEDFPWNSPGETSPSIDSDHLPKKALSSCPSETVIHFRL